MQYTDVPVRDVTSHALHVPLQAARAQQHEHQVLQASKHHLSGAIRPPRADSCMHTRTEARGSRGTFYDVRVQGAHHSHLSCAIDVCSRCLTLSCLHVNLRREANSHCRRCDGTQDRALQRAHGLHSRRLARIATTMGHASLLTQAPSPAAIAATALPSLSFAPSKADCLTDT